MATTKSSETLVLTSKQNGIVVIPTGTPLTRLNYFDGKFLRASDLKAEQDYLRHLVQQSNQAGGSGVAHGYDVTLGSGDTLNIGPGLAIDAQGRVLLLPQGTSMGIQNLIDKSRDLHKFFAKTGTGGGSFGACEEESEAPPINTTSPNSIYKIVISAAEALCGEEDVYGKLCEEACSTSTDRPLLIEGVVVRAIPLEVAPTTKGQLNQINLRSRTAAAYFEFERSLVSSLISGEGLKQQIWCLGADADDHDGVAIGVIARAGNTTVFLDPWIVRRELIDTPARRYWQWRMAMRPWDVFLAQILQFQCQLRDLFKTFPNPSDGTPCSDARDAINEAALAIAEMRKYFEQTTQRLVEFKSELVPFEGGANRLEKLNTKLDTIYKVLATTPADRWLINGGMIEIPSTGYLPVVPGTEVSVNQQIRKMMGEGVDLRFCVVRPDYVAHALEEAQHMERISLIDGLENAALKPQVDILVPDGEITTPAPAPPVKLIGFAATGEFRSFMQETSEPSTRVTDLPILNFQGAARSESTSGGGAAIYLSCASHQQYVPALRAGVSKDEWLNQSKLDIPLLPGDPPVGLWLSLKCDSNPFKAKQNDTINVAVEALVAAQNPNKVNILEFSGTLSGKLIATSVGADPQHNINGDAELTHKVTLPEPSIDEQGTPKYVYQSELPKTDELRFSAQAENIRLEFGIEAKGSINFIKVTVLTTPKLQFTTKLTVNLVENADVFSEANLNHGLAIQSLKLISEAKKEPSFVSDKTKLLFPSPPAKGTDETTVRATRDWVLFHRRRTRQCAVAGAARRYQVYQFAATSDAVKQFDLRSLNDVVPKSPLTTADLQKVSAAQLQVFSLIGEVGFGASSSSIAGDISTLKSHWKKISGGQIVWGAIGSRGDAAGDGDTLAQSRLKTLEAALDQVSPSARADVLPIVPPPLENAGFDGVIVLINGGASSRSYRVFELTQTKLQQLATGTFDVNAFLNDPDGWSKVSAKVWDLFDEVGVVTFGPDAATLTSDPAALATGWKPVPSGQISRAAIASRDDALNDGPTLSTDRVKSVEAAVTAITKTHQNARVDLLTTMPPINDSGVDGVMVFLNGKFSPPAPPYGSNFEAIGGENI